MSRDEIICGLDIGSTAIRMAVGQFSDVDGGGLKVIGVAEAPAEGINKGVINSIEEATSSITACVEKIERITGVPLTAVWASISGSHITSQISKGVVAVSKTDGEISEEDIERSVEAARAVATPPNYEILHVIPRSFAVDSQEGIKDPVGMTGIRLEVEAQIIQGLSAQIKNLTKCVYRTGLDIEDLVLSILAATESTLTNRQKELGVVLVNIGGPTTSVAVFEEGDIMHTAVLPLGSVHITSDIAIGLRVSIDAAEKIKLEYGSSLAKDINKREEVDLAEFDENEEEKVSRKHVCEIIEARVEEIFDKVDDELKKIDRSGMLPAGVVLTGGGAKLPNLVEAAKKRLRLPASLGYPVNITSPIDKVNDPSFATVLGLVMWGHEASRQTSGKFGKMLTRFKSVDQARNKLRKWFKRLVP